MVEQGSLARDAFGWGALLWAIGYVLGIVLYPLVPVAEIGWYVMPCGLAVTCLVLWRWVVIRNPAQGLGIGLVWSLLAMALDYLFIVKLMAPADGYYKPDVWLYYLSALLLPVLAGVWRGRLARR